MLEPPRVGLPNIVGQVEVIARTRGAQAGAEQAAHAVVVASIQQESIRRAEQVPATHLVEGLEKDPKGHPQGGRHGHHDGADDDELGDEDDDGHGHLLDVMA